jgi:mono/diheme cytochrome c family protein
MRLHPLGPRLSVTLLLLAGSAGLSLAQEEQIIARGQVHYQRYCAVCHGEQGKGQGALAEYLKITPTDLTQLSKKNGGHFPFWQVYRVVDGREAVRGHGTREMPLWGEEIRRDEKAALPRFQEDLIAGRLWQLLSYLQSIQEQ